jgi:hypothetical protein
MVREEFGIEDDARHIDTHAIYGEEEVEHGLYLLAKRSKYEWWLLRTHSSCQRRLIGSFFCVCGNDGRFNDQTCTTTGHTE